MDRQDKKQLVNALRRYEVEREFRNAQESITAPEAFSERALYLWPWRERHADGSIGPWYGPMNESAFEREMKAYEDKREAGSLWDDEEAAKAVPVRYLELQAGPQRARTSIISRSSAETSSTSFMS